jgi:hypothetical protein
LSKVLKLLEEEYGMIFLDYPLPLNIVQKTSSTPTTAT